MTEAHYLPELSRRQERILAMIIQTYTENPEPVSSKQLAENEDLGVSSATVRNDMARLEELGYINAPHTSAGRIPTARGYRYFVKSLMQHSNLPLAERNLVTQKFGQMPAILEHWLREAARVLAVTAHSASLVTPPITDSTRFKHLQLIAIQGRLALLVLVTQGGTVHQRMLSLAEPVPQPTLSEAAERINGICASLNANQVRLKSRQFPLLEREVAELAADLLDTGTSQHFRVVYRDGLSEIIGNFQDGEGVQQAVRVLEERPFLEMILAEFLQSPADGDDVRVIIEGEGKLAEINRVSIIISRYGMPGSVTGALGVIGPTHINYGRAISTVRHVSGLMTNTLMHLYETHSDNALEEDNGNTITRPPLS